MYSTGTATTVSDLGAAIKTFLEANSWLETDGDDNGGIGSGFQLGYYFPTTGGAEYPFVFLRIRSKNEVVAPFAIDYNAACIDCVPSSQYTDGIDNDGSHAYYQKTGAPKYMTGTTPIGISCPIADTNIPYQFFSNADGDAIVLCCGRAGFYNYIAFGTGPTLIGRGDISGHCGPWYCASRAAEDGAKDSAGGVYNMGVTLPPYPPGSSGFNRMPLAIMRIKADSDASLQWVAMGNSESQPQRTPRRGFGATCPVAFAIGGGPNESLPMMGELVARSFSQMAGHTELIPAEYGIERDEGGFSYYCQLPLLWACYVERGLAMGAEITRDTTTYRVFGTFAVEVIA